MSSRSLRRKRLLQQRVRQFGLAISLSLFVLAGYFLVYLLANEHPDYVRFSGIAVTAAASLAGGYFLYRTVTLISSYGGVLEKQAGTKVTKTEGKFKALIQNSMDLITIIDRQGAVTYQSPSSERILGYTPDELVGQSIFELIHESEHALMKNVLEQQSRTFFFSYRMQHRDGTWLHFEAAGTNLLSNELIQGIVINARDITDRKKEEEARRQKELAAVQFNQQREEAVREKKIIEEQKQELESAYNLIEEKNEEITDSITYAFRIQTALLPSIENVQDSLPNSFVLWKPKDIVSGDFYWFAQRDQYRLIAAADCTGHGVPGAFMTMIGNTLLNQIILQEGIVMPDQILNNLHKMVRSSLKQDTTDSKDGMDIAFLTYDTEANKLYFAGANNPLIIVRNRDYEEIKADKQAIGGTQEEDERRFTLQETDVQPGDSYYVYSDGYQDQFGGPRGRKYMTKKFKKKLTEVSVEHPQEQKKILDQEIMDWMGEEYEQIDDIIVIGLKF